MRSQDSGMLRPLAQCGSTPICKYTKKKAFALSCFTNGAGPVGPLWPWMNFLLQLNSPTKVQIEPQWSGEEDFSITRRRAQTDQRSRNSLAQIRCIGPRPSMELPGRDPERRTPARTNTYNRWRAENANAWVICCRVYCGSALCEKCLQMWQWREVEE